MKKRKLLTPLILLGWLIAIGFGFTRIFTYANIPGKSAQPLPQWPEGATLSRSKDLATLVIFAHPHCPCSEASLGELEKLMPRIVGKAKSYVVFYKPQNKTEEWVQDSLWKKAQSIPSVTALIDEAGIEAARFDAKTSGQTFLYSPEGNLVFQGGITAQRGHMGDNDGQLAILSYFKQENPSKTPQRQLAQTPVFGCSLKNPERAKTSEVYD
jgi:hypothetical protein